MQYQQKSFSVPVGQRDPEICRQLGHGWVDQKGRCRFCGDLLLRITPESDPKTPEPSDE